MHGSARLTCPVPTRRRSRGVTLLEMMVVLVIIGLVAALSVTAYGSYLKKARATKCGVQLVELKNGVEAFNMAYGRYPNALDELLQPPDLNGKKHDPLLEKLPKDPWMKEFVYEKPGKAGKAYDLLSAGPDGTLGTEDDIHVGDVE